ncbi:MAG: HU family DNA-binding protein [Bacteroidaceae bacterium]|nr:HU family DNA-binding protein [Bacteroidaceae bacterium]
MNAQYDMKPGLGPQETEGTPVLYPKLVPHGTKTLKDIMHHAQMHTGLNASTVQGVVTFLEDVLAEYLANGYNVKLGNIGTFTTTLKSRKVTTREEIRAKSIHFDNVSFRAAKELKKAISLQMKLERVSPHKAFRASSDKYTAEERFHLLTEYLDKHGYITRSEYSELTGLLKTKAAAELKNWYQEQKIGKDGRVPHIIYKKKEVQAGTASQGTDSQEV